MLRRDRSLNSVWTSLDRLARVAVFGLAVASLARLGARQSWLLELTTHFSPLYAAGFLVGGLWLGIRRCRYWRACLLVATFGLSWHGYLMAPAWIEAPARARERATTVRAMFVNVLAGRGNQSRIRELVREFDPDFLGLVETRRVWSGFASELREQYPHQHIEWRTDNFGLALLSKHPLENATTHYLDRIVPTLTATTRIGGTPVDLIVTHPTPPSGAEWAARRNRQLAALARLGKGSPNLLLMGDLNVSPWSPYFEQLIAEGDYSNTRPGFGLLGSWGPGSLGHGLGCYLVPIDHILLRGPWRVLELRTGSSVDSDHLPLLAELEFGGRLE